MKIKEVMAQTDLTDRAIRIYIENELITPSYTENFQGRKSFDFSEKDIELLKNIAILRKTGFSIAEIKSLKNSKENCRTILKDIYDRKEKQIATDLLVSASLEILLKETELTFEVICTQLKKNATENQVPENTVTAEEKRLADKTENFITASLLAFGAWLIMFLIEISFYIKEFDFLYFQADEVGLFRLSLHFIAFLLPLTLFIINKKSYKNKTEKQKQLRLKASSAICWLLLPLVQLMFFNMIFSVIAPSVHSQTENPEDYVKITIYHKLFPYRIPREAENVEFFYRYRNAIDSDSDFLAQWSLPDEEYEAAKKEALNYTGEITFQRIKGDWKCIYFEDYEENSDHTLFYYVIFAYNDETNTVRYIYSSSQWGHTPYYLTVDW